ncbi:anoctamin-6 isoform X5 [Canis lupus baileyi]|uniref:Anoctamin n=2 Tax=Canis lupus familiaris TaxID=9615 RepID=A0A8C0PIR2_CANLF|nr:anoctamin-6 isoform X1 [Canis lupus familiaris]XP_025333137.1 anoctamin-6 isoform X4 [Canis lupus dingo]XP_038294345.1 anoctamin-6 isoform X1 [Canis lupus familiaris]XP_038433342.1 anoctamin-6 isoform X1 [Canis lupus familiaris]|eukprot:XP_005637010.1 anoctamin-6 isoform X1 [Canis lupus familiaris]
MQMMTRDVLLGMEEEEDDDDGDIGDVPASKRPFLTPHPSSLVLDNLEQTTVSNFGPLESQPDFRTPEFEEFNGKHDSLFFNDGQRRIDFVLVYEDESRKETNKKGSNEKQRRKRQAYESNLICGGLQLEATRSVLDDKLIFVKVHAPWEVLCTYAEIMHIKLPLKPNDLKTRSSAFGNFSWFTKVLQVDESIIKPEQEFFTAPFEKNRMNDFYIHDRDTFFNPATRSRIVYFILSRIQYQVRDNVKKFGINKLVSSGIYKAAFPLHDCNFSQRSEDPSCPSERYLLYREWAHPRSIYKKQPLDLIRKYYGEKIGIYFAWLGYYTQMLFLAAIVGVACFLYGYVNQNNCTWSKEVCHPDIGGKIIMCPQCDKICPFWKLNSTCESSKKLCIFDSFGTLVFAVFMGVWVTLFLEFWKRRQAELEYEWDTVELQQEEQPRPEYEAQCTHVVINEITQEEEHVPFTTWGKCIRVTLCASAVLFWILLIIASVIGIIVYRLSVLVVFSTKLSQTFNGTDPIQKYLTPQTATSITASVISFIIIMILNTIYEKVAIMITNFELPRTQTDYENSLTMKMFLFQFVNYYSSCFYIAFFKGKFVGYPGDPTYWLGKYRNEECEPGGCLLELTTQLTIIMGGKAIWNNIQEVLLPWIKNLIGRYHTASRTEKKSPRWEQDYHLQLMGKLGLFYEYLEMIIQFGFVTLFVASFPLAPLLALVNNILEIRVDAWKMTTQYRRMVPEKAQDIGAWQPIMQGIAILAVVTNAMIIAFTSDMIPRLVYYWSFSVPPYGNHTQYTMEGYINSTLSYFNVSDFKSRSRGSSASDFDIRTCRYRDFRNPPGHPQEYKHNIYYWHVITAKLAFIIVMEHVIYSVKFFISYAIPDVSKRTKSKIKREKYLTQKLLHENHLKDMTKTMGVIAERMGPVVTDNNLRPKSE